MYRFNESRRVECEIGYSIGRKFWGQGLGKKIVEKLIKTIERDAEIREIIAWTHPENIGSIKILEKNGFQRMEQEEYPDNYLYWKANKI